MFGSWNKHTEMSNGRVTPGGRRSEQFEKPTKDF